MRIGKTVVKESWALLRETGQAWHKDNAPRMAAALAFYTTFSLGPALLIALWVAGVFVGASTAESILIAKLAEFVTPETAEFVSSVIRSFWGELTGRRLPLVGIGSAIVAATAVFAELHSSLNSIWSVQPKRAKGLLGFIYSRVLSFTLVVGMGVFLLVSIITGTVLSAIDDFLSSAVLVPMTTMPSLDPIGTFTLLPVLLAMAYKLVPDTPVKWRDVWLGAALASLLFLAGRYLFGSYMITLPSVYAVYGAAGSLVMLLLWVYYSSLVFFFGAEFTKVYAHRRGKGRGFSRNGQSGSCDGS